MDRLRTVEETVAGALREDFGSGDVTASLVPEDARVRARVITREDAVLCGRPWAESVFRQLDASIRMDWHHADGDELMAGDTLFEMSGPARPILSGERTALNFLQTLSGTATLTRRYAKALDGTHTQVLDTRKTIPGLREAQKYAVRCGGGRNHRMGLYDGLLIKENHIAAAGSIQAAVGLAKSTHPGLPVEVEVENLQELEQAIAAAADIVLLDNFDLEGLRAAVAMVAGRLKLEASGGYDLTSIRAAAETGVDYISVGSLTKHVHGVDLSMRLID